MSTYSASIKSNVLNRGRPTTDFLDTLVAWAQRASDEIFVRNENYDIYSSIYPQLGPWKNLTHRKAAMCEALRVLAGFESSWNWNEGADTTAGNETPDEMEAGVFQCSANAMNFDKSLKKLMSDITGGSIDSWDFQRLTKSNHTFAVEFCARLLRFTVNHHGPVKRKEINPWLNRQAVSDFMDLLMGGSVVINPDPAEESSSIPWYDKAMSYKGIHEIPGPRDNPWIEDCFSYTSYGRSDHDEVPWCAAFMCRVLEESGYKHTHSALAASYAHYGTPCDLVKGSILVFPHHVTICDHIVDIDYVAGLGGNQSDQVKVSNYLRDNLIGVRWPVKK